MKELIFLLFLTAASFSDIRYHRIDNGLNLTGALAGLFFLISANNIYMIKDGFYAAGLVFISLFLLFVLRLIGAGDIKFLMAAVLFTGKAVLLSSVPYMLSAAVIISFPRIIKQRSFINIRFPAAVPISTGLLFGMLKI